MLSLCTSSLYSLHTHSLSYPLLRTRQPSLLLEANSSAKFHLFLAFSFDFPSMAAINRDSTSPPVIGKIGPYTVFMTPPSTPKSSPEPVVGSPKKIVPPPVQPPPPQIDKLVAEKSVADGDGSVLGFFKNAVAKVQSAHASLDDQLARWFGLNQSKYQWALDDYYETRGMEKGDIKVKEISSKVRSA